VIVCVKSFP